MQSRRAVQMRYGAVAGSVTMMSVLLTSVAAASGPAPGTTSGGRATTPSGRTGTVEVIAVEDSHVRPGRPAAAAGDAKVLVASAEGRRAYLKFRVPALPPGATLTAARLVLASTAGGSGRLQARESPSTWHESTLTARSAPATGRLLGTSISTGTTTTVDLGRAVEGGRTFSVALSAGTGRGRFSSSEGARPPRLRLRWHAAAASSRPAVPGARTSPTTALATAAPVALVYRGPAGCPGCSEAVARLLTGSRWGFDVRYVGPAETLQLSPTTLAGAALYVQPGGSGTTVTAFSALDADAPAVRDYVAKGGRYLGICMGAYLSAGKPGFDLLPGEAWRYANTSGATLTTTRKSLVQVRWQGVTRTMYAADPNYFKIPRSTPGLRVLGEYLDGRIAAMTVPYGRGRVGGVGPHPEADALWYGTMVDPDGPDADLGRALVDAVMR